MINKKTLQEKRERVRQRMAVMSCVSNGVSFTKYASRLIDAPCKLSFKKENDVFVAFKDDEFGLNVAPYHTVFQISSRPLARLFEDIFKTKKPKFIMRATTIENMFELKLITK